PLGVLALGAVFSGMIWYGSFFGDHDKVNAFFGIEHHAEAVEGEAAPAAETTEPAAEAAEPAAAPDLHAGTAPVGAIFMAPGNTVIDDAHHAPVWVKVSPFIAMLIGLAVAFWFYILNPEAPKRLAAAQPPLYRFLLNKWYFDEIYDAIFVRPAKALGRFLWKRGDGTIIDGTINGIAMSIIPFFTKLAGRWQSGYIFTYAFAMVLGIVALVTI